MWVIIIFLYFLKEDLCMTKESKFQSDLIKEIKKTFPGCMVLKNDPTYIQGIPDLLVLYKNKWAALEVKKDKKAKHQPNQNHYILKMNKMSFGRFVYPENKQEVMHDLQQAFGVRRATCSTICKQTQLDKIRQHKVG